MSQSAESPKIGIFWLIPNDGAKMLVSDQITLSEGEIYGDCLTYPHGHFEVWETWRRLGSVDLARRGLPAVIPACEYEDFPRGRVVYQRVAEVFFIYADRKLFSPPTVADIVQRFGLKGSTWSLKPDDHYRS